MIKGEKAVPDEDTNIDLPSTKGKDLLLLSGNVVNKGASFVFAPQGLRGSVSLTMFDAKGKVIYSSLVGERVEVSTDSFSQGVYFYISEDEAGYKESGKLLVK